MAGKVVVDAVAARLAANWTVIPIVDDDAGTTPPADGSAYVTIEYPVSTEMQITVGSPGNNVFRESGAFRIKIVCQIGTGIGQPLAWIDQIRAIFRGQHFGTVTTYAPSPGVIDNTNYVAGKFIISSSVPYIANFFA